MNADQSSLTGNSCVIQPCSEACSCFRRLPGDRWLDFGLCRNPASPFQGCVVRIGRDCPRYRTDPLPADRGTG